MVGDTLYVQCTRSKLDPIVGWWYSIKFSYFKLMPQFFFLILILDLVSLNSNLTIFTTYGIFFFVITSNSKCWLPKHSLMILSINQCNFNHNCTIRFVCIFWSCRSKQRRPNPALLPSTFKGIHDWD